jgi:hypothetical protein
MTRVISVANVRRVIGFAIVVAGVWITFLPVSADIGPFDYHIACGSVWHAMLSHGTDHDCVLTALPHVWIAGGVAAVGMGVAFLGGGPSSAIGNGWAGRASYPVDHARRMGAIHARDGCIERPGRSGVPCLLLPSAVTVLVGEDRRDRQRGVDERDLDVAIPLAAALDER